VLYAASWYLAAHRFHILTPYCTLECTVTVACGPRILMAISVDYWLLLNWTDCWNSRDRSLLKGVFSFSSSLFLFPFDVAVASRIEWLVGMCWSLRTSPWTCTHLVVFCVQYGDSCYCLRWLNPRKAELNWPPYRKSTAFARFLGCLSIIQIVRDWHGWFSVGSCSSSFLLRRCSFFFRFLCFVSSSTTQFCDFGGPPLLVFVVNARNVWTMMLRCSARS